MFSIKSAFLVSKGDSKRCRFALAVVLVAISQLWIACNLVAQTAEYSTQTPAQSGRGDTAQTVLSNSAADARSPAAAVEPCRQCVAVEISPANPIIAAGEKIQFSALVSNTSDTAVRWSASAGSISTTGLFQAPRDAQARSITVTASRAAEKTARASTTVSIATAERLSASPMVSNATQTCGPPAYSCSRKDLHIAQVPSAVPDVGSLLGANTIITDPDFSNRVVRITDAHTNPETDFKNITFVTTSSGSADDNLWNIDSTLFVVQDAGSGTYPFTFNPSTLQAARMYRSSFPATNGLKLPEGGDWSRLSADVLYTYSGTAIHKYDFTDRSTPPAQELLYDFTSSPNCLPAGFSQTWQAKGGVSSDDAVFGMAYSDQGNQGTGIYVVVYKAGSGCSMLNTRTGQVSGDWGTSGTIAVADRWTIHNAKLSKDGNWMVIARDRCTASPCSEGPYFWEVGTTHVISCGRGGSCGGHWTEGYTHWENNDNSPISNQVMRSFAEAGSVDDLTDTFPSGLAAPFDQHQSWNNVDAADSLPFFSTTCTTTSPFTAPWYNEIIAVASDGSGTTWRFAHSFITARSQTFSTQNGIGTVSQDGRFFLFSSDWMGKLGSLAGSSACRIGHDCRGDVFVVELR